MEYRKEHFAGGGGEKSLYSYLAKWFLNISNLPGIPVNLQKNSQKARKKGE